MWFTYIVVAASVLAYTEAHPQGGHIPKEVCKTMMPGGPHSTPNTSPPPYVITTNTQAVEGGTPIEVVVRGKDTSRAFRGLMLQARRGDEIVGTFTIGATDLLVQPFDCDAAGDTVVHTSVKEKRETRLTWTAPSDFSGEIKFRATIVETRTESWLGVESAPVKVTPKKN